MPTAGAKAVIALREFPSDDGEPSNKQFLDSGCQVGIHATQREKIREENRAVFGGAIEYSGRAVWGRGEAY